MLDPDTNIPIAIGQRILGERSPISQMSTPYGEGVKDLYAAQSRMLQKLAMKFPDKYMVCSFMRQEVASHLIF